MNKNFRSPGVALVAVFMVLALLVSVAIALLQVAVSNTAITDHTRDSQQALMMAQAGMSQAINELNLGKSLTGQAKAGNPKATWGVQQKYEVTTADNGDGTMTITSIGTFMLDQSAGNIMQVQRQLKAVVARPADAGKFLAGGFGKSSVTLTGVAQTDSYDSGVNLTYAQ